MPQTIEDYTLSMIKYIDDITISIGDCIELFGKSSTPSMLVDNIHGIENAIKNIDRTIVMMPSCIQKLQGLYKIFFSTLASTRNNLICKINERKSKDIQMNTNGNLYNEDNLINDIGFAIDKFGIMDINNIEIDQIIDPEKYSILGIVSLFNNERVTLSELHDLISRNLTENLTSLNSYKENISNFKSLINDGEIINKLLEDDTSTYNMLLEKVKGYNYRLNKIRGDLKLIFKIYKALINNYGIYTTAINQYTSLVLESFFNTNSSYEIC